MTPCSATPGPVLRLGRPLGLPVSIHYVSEPPLGILVLAPLELEVRQPQLQPDQELVRPKESLDPVLLPALGGRASGSRASRAPRGGAPGLDVHPHRQEAPGHRPFVTAGKDPMTTVGQPIGILRRVPLP
jgi:hypothetical protein